MPDSLPKRIAHHRTQGGEHLVRAIESNTVETSQDSYVQTVTEPVQLLLGKSLVVSAPSDPHTRYYLRVQGRAPEIQLAGRQNSVVSAEADNQTIGTIPIRVQLSAGWVAPQ
jgi:hypothetical protein